MKLAMRVEGLDELAKALKETPKVTRALLRDTLRTSTEAVTAHAKTLAPRDRGDLADAINYSGRGLSWRAGVEDTTIESRIRWRKTLGQRGASRGKPVYNTAHANPSVYGRFVEYGTKRTTAHPFMRPAADAERERLPGRLRALVADLEREVEHSKLPRQRDTRGRFIS